MASTTDTKDIPLTVMAMDVDHDTAVGHLVNQEDHEMTIKQAITTQTSAVCWCLFSVWMLLLAAYDQNAPALYLAIPKFREDFGVLYEGQYILPAKWQTAFNAGEVATFIIGALVSGYIADRIGRKTTLMGTLVISYIAITLEMVATHDAVYFAGELVNGLSVGTLGTVCITYVEEVAPLPLRGVMNCIVAMAWTIAPFFASLVLYGVGGWDTRWAYRALICSQYGFAAVATILVPFMPESPPWLLSQGKEEKALRSLRKLGLKRPGQAENRIAYLKLILERIRVETEGVTYAECFRKSNLRRTMISIAPLSIQALSGVSWLASYAAYYLELAGYGTRASFILNIIFNVLGVVSNVCSWWLIDRVGRRNLTFYGLLGIVIQFYFIGGLGTQVNNTSAIKGVVAFMMIWSFWYSLTIGSSAYALLGEVATTRLRAKTIALGLAVQNVLYLVISFVIPYLFNPNEGNLGAKTAFVFAGLSTFSLVYLHFCQPETTGRSYEELDEMFVKKIPARQFKTYQPEAEIAGKLMKEKLAAEE